MTKDIGLLPEYDLTGYEKSKGISRDEAVQLARELGAGVVVGGYVEKAGDRSRSRALCLMGMTAHSTFANPDHGEEARRAGCRGVIILRLHLTYLSGGRWSSSAWMHSGADLGPEKWLGDCGRTLIESLLQTPVEERGAWRSESEAATARLWPQDPGARGLHGPQPR